MTACEACWNRAFTIARTTGRHQAEVYRELLASSERCNSTEYSNKAIYQESGYDPD